MKKIRVLEIIHGFAVESPLGGIERFVIELAQTFDPAEIEPIVYGMWSFEVPNEQKWLGHLRERGIEAFMPAVWNEQQPYQSFRQSLGAARRHLEGQQIDIIHSHCQFGDGIALLLGRHVGAKKLVRTIHNEREWGRRPLRRLLLTNLLYPLVFKKELGVSQQVVDNLNRRLVPRLLKQPALRAYNSLNFRRFERGKIDRAAKKASLNIPEDASVVGTVGRLTEQKGYHIWLEAAALVGEERANTYFVIIGGGELEKSLKAQAAQLGIEERVIFTGPRSDVEELLQVMDLFVSSSLWEGLPTVILESMAARVPVVATRVSGNSELIEEGVTGRLVPPAEPQKLAQAILNQLAASPAETAAMCERAYEYALANFSIEQVAEQHTELYRMLLNHK